MADELLSKDALCKLLRLASDLQKVRMARQYNGRVRVLLDKEATYLQVDNGLHGAIRFSLHMGDAAGVGILLNALEIDWEEA